MAGLLIAIGLVVLIVAHELGHFLAAKAFRLFVPEFGIGFPPRLWGKRYGETEYTVNALPIGGFVRIAGEDDEGDGSVAASRLLSKQKPWKRAIVIAAGVGVNVVLAWLLLSVVLAVGTPKVLVIAAVEKDSPAAAAGLKGNDVIVGYETAAAFAQAAREHVGQPFNVAVQRGSGQVELEAVPQEPSPEHPGALGVSLVEGGIERVPAWKAPIMGTVATWNLGRETVMGFVGLVQRLLSGSVPSDVVGPVGIVSTASQIGQVGAIYLVQMLALISINLAVLNLLPIPALDGGRLYLTLVEMATGKKLPKWLEGRLNALTFILLIGLMLLLTARDVFRLF